MSVAWSVASGPGPVGFGNPASVTTTATFNTDGTYVLRLTASDTELSAFDDVTIAVARENLAPVVSAGADQTITLPSSAVTLSGTVTDDGLPTGAAVTVFWSLLSGPSTVVFGSPASASTSASFDAVGTYVLRLTASDSALSASDDVTVAVQGTPPSGDPPSVAIASPSEGTGITSPTSVTGTVRSDALFSWKLESRRRSDPAFRLLASGTTTAENAVLGTFDPTLVLNGIHEIRLSATDTAGRTVRTSVNVVVKDNQKVGNFTVSFVDLEVPVAGLPIRVTRTYDSRDKAKGDFGFGWRLDISSLEVQENGTAGSSWEGTKSGGGFPSCLQPVKPQVVTITFPDGKVYEFAPVVTPQCQSFVPIEEATISFRPLPGTLGTLAPVDGGRVIVVGSWPGPMQLFGASDFRLYDPSLYRFTAIDGRSFVVEEGKGLKSLTDLSGNTLSVTPGGITASNPAVTGSSRNVVFTRDTQNRITSITDPVGSAMTYAYDGSGDLQIFTDREQNATRFGYSVKHPHLLETIKDPLGRQPIRNEYYDDGRIKSHTDAFGKTITYSHDLSARQEVVTDRNGQTRVLNYDARGNVVKETDPNGKIVLRTFDVRNNRLTETLPHDPTDTNSPTTVYTYTASDFLESVTDPESHRTEYTYNAKGQVLTTKDARGSFTINAYDLKGNLLSTKVAASLAGPALSETTYTYLANGSLESQTVVVDGVSQTTRYEYFPSGDLKKETDAANHSTEYTYDKNGNRLTQTTTRTLPGSATETLTTTSEYDKLGRLTKTIDPDGSFTRTVYDELGRQKESYDKLGRKTEFSYDEMGRLVKTTYPDTTTEESGYDPEGRRTSSKDRGGRTTRYEYDALGRLTKMIYPGTPGGEPITENRYDAAGQLVETIDARGKSTFYEYDAAGRRTKVKAPIGAGLFAETVFTYDANGNQETVKDANQNTVSYVYDEHNRRTKTIFPDATYTETGYDVVGRRTSERDQAGKLTRFEYDALGRLSKVLDALNQETSYGYDALGNRTSQTDANLHTTRFEYDKLGRETARILPDGKRETKTYDDAGRLIGRTDFNRRTTVYQYEPLTDRLAKKTPPAGLGEPEVTFTYTPAGRRETVTDGRGTTSYGYDVRDRLKSLTYPDGRRLEYEYDAQGNRTKLTAVLTALSLVTNYTFDDTSRLARVTDPALRTYEHGYDPNGSRTSLAYPNGTRTDYTYNTLNRLTNLTTVGPLGMVQSYAFTLGPAGNRTQITEHDGTVREYGYDDLYRLTDEKVTINGLLDYSKAFTYDPVGNRKTQTTVGTGAPGTSTAPGTIDYGYDDRDRLLTETGIAGGYGYDANGNLTTKDAEATYTWDFENRLVKVTKTDGTVIETVYDADGNRVRTTTTKPSQASEVLDYLVDTSGGLSHVVAETNGATGALKAYYVRGDDLLAVMRPNGSGGFTTRFVHADGLGSIRRLTDEAGNITDGWSYTSFGETYGRTGNDPIPYQFAGEPYDPNSGFYYHRARWMDPRVGRFVGMDAFAGRPEDPVTLHRYLYAGVDPARMVDPSGEDFSIADVSIANALSMQIDSSNLRNASDAVFDSLFRDNAAVQMGRVIVNAAGIAIGVSALALRVARSGFFQKFIFRSGVIKPSVWTLPPLTRGKQIEDAVARSDYAEWFHVGALNNGKFPLVDFQKGQRLVSLKSADPSAESALTDLMDHIDDLATRGATVNGLPAQMGLDIRVPPGQESLLRDLIEYGGGRGVVVKIKAFP